MKELREKLANAIELIDVIEANEKELESINESLKGYGAKNVSGVKNVLLMRKKTVRECILNKHIEFKNILDSL